MQTEYKNKSISSTGPENVKIKSELPEQEYFFAGGGEYLPVTITARTAEEARIKWEKQRMPTGQNTSTTIPKATTDKEAEE